MAAPAKPRSLFGQQLRAQLERHPNIDSVRRLAHAMAPDRPEHARRMLQKWIAGDAKPTIASRYVVAQALGVDAAVFAEDDEDEDESEMRDLIGALMHQVGVVVDRKVDARFAELQLAESKIVADALREIEA